MYTDRLVKLPAVFAPPDFHLREIIFNGQKQPKRILTVLYTDPIFGFRKTEVKQLLIG